MVDMSTSEGLGEECGHCPAEGEDCTQAHHHQLAVLEAAGCAEKVPLQTGAFQTQNPVASGS